MISKNKHTDHLILIILMIGMLTACEKKTVDFSFSPKEPKAGETVRFSNLSSSGEEWEWNFGDGSKATNKIPTHIYKQPGKYVIQLKVDNKNELRCTHEITVYDTIPNFSSTIVDSIGTDIFEEEEFEALVYNPYNYTISYKWSVEGLPFTQISATNTAKTYKIYFESIGKATVELQIVLNGDTTTVRHNYVVNDVPAHAILMQNDKGENFRQRIYNIKHEVVSPLTYQEGITLLQNAQDTMQTYNGKIFTIKDLNSMGYPIDGFAIANRKIYFRSGGLYVSNLDGQHVVEIDADSVYALCIDATDNRLYWARKNAIMYLPLIGSDNNQFTTKPMQANCIENIIKMTIDTSAR